jgi:hypothetical protein
MDQLRAAAIAEATAALADALLTLKDKRARLEALLAAAEQPTEKPHAPTAEDWRYDNQQ